MLPLVGAMRNLHCARVAVEPGEMLLPLVGAMRNLNVIAGIPGQVPLLPLVGAMRNRR